MRQLAAILFFSFVPFALPAQDVLDKVARETCDCVNTLDKSMDTEALQMQLGLCMLKAASPYEKELRKQHRVDMARLDHGAGERLGELVGMRMAGICPDMLMVIVDAGKGGASVESAPAMVAQVTGVVTGVRDRQFATVLVKDVSGRTVELLRLEHFPNADRLSDAGVNGLRATFSYTVKELYDPVAGTYRAHNVLVGLEPE